MIDITPNPIAFPIGPFPVHWYGICYARRAGRGLLSSWSGEARRRGQDPELVGNGIVVVAIAALIGGRLYHVIDQWALYQADPITTSCRSPSRPAARTPSPGSPVSACPAASSPARSPAGCYTRRWKVDVLDVGGHRRARPVRDAGDRPARQLLQPGAVRAADDPAVGHRDRLRPSRRAPTRATTFPVATTHFHPLFLYESLSGLLGAVRPALARPRTGVRAPARRPAPDLLHLVRDDALPARVHAERQLDVLRDPDGPDRVRDLHRGRARAARLSPPSRRHGPHPTGRRSPKPTNRSPRSASRNTPPA